MEQMVKELVNEVGGWDTEPKRAEQVVDKHKCGGGAGEPSGQHGDWSTRAALCGKFRHILISVRSRWEMQDASEERMQNANRRVEHIFRS